MTGVESFVRAWYRDPLGPGDGAAEAEIAAAERVVGAPLPAVVRMWFSRVDRRLRCVQDTPMTVADISTRAGRLRGNGDPDEASNQPRTIPLWIENQGVWSILARLDDGDDPRILVTEGYAGTDARVSDALYGMLVSDTIVAAWCGDDGPLGPLAPGVLGGCVDDFTDDPLVSRELPALDSVFRNPFFADEHDCPLLGDADMVVRYNGSNWEWMSRTPAAYERLRMLFDLEPVGGQRELVCRFAALDENERAIVDRLPLPEAVRDVGFLGKTKMAGGQVAFYISTRDVAACVKRVLATVPQPLHRKLRCEERPVDVMRFALVYPPPS